MSNETPVLESRIQELEREKRALQRQIDDLHNDLAKALNGYRANDIHYQVTEFQNAFGYPVRTTPVIPPDFEVRLRAKLSDEYFEFLEALFGERNAISDMRSGLERLIAQVPLSIDMVKLADALADCDYVNEGCRIVFGINGKPIARIVHEANMAKRGGPKVDGKQLKPPGWVGPEAAIRAELLRQGWRP